MTTKASLGERLLLTGALMMLLSVALLVTELIQGWGLGSRYSIGVGVAGVAVLAVGGLASRRHD